MNIQYLLNKIRLLFRKYVYLYIFCIFIIF
nr:MAG TPA: hypothetical protein [Microviridae sp.]